MTAHTFDLVGAKAVGMRGAYLDRHENPYRGWTLRPDLRVDDAAGLVALGEAGIEAIDAAMVHREGFPMGPFELDDHTGRIQPHAEREADFLSDPRPLGTTRR